MKNNHDNLSAPSSMTDMRRSNSFQPTATTVISFNTCLAIGFLVLASIGKSIGQPKTIHKVAILQSFEVGKTYNYEVQRGKSDSRQPGSEKMKSSTEVHLSIESATGTLRKCVWKYGTTSLIGMSADPQTAKLLNLYEGMEVRFNLDEVGRIQEITNFEECKAYLEKASAVIYENSEIKPEKWKQIQAMLANTYSTPEIMVNTYCPELTIFFTIFGENIEMDTTYVTQSELSNPFGGKNFSTNVAMNLALLSDSIATIAIEQTIPESSLNAIMKETFVEIAKQAGKPFREDDILKMQISTRSVYTYNHLVNTLKEVKVEKFIEVDDVKQIQTISVLLKN
jgi:hypothetical protein